MLFAALFTGFTSLFIILVLTVALCAKSEDKKKDKKDKEKEGKDRKDEGQSKHDSSDSVFHDPLEEISENVTFHVIANSNKKARAEAAQKKEEEEKKKQQSSVTKTNTSQTKTKTSTLDSSDQTDYTESSSS